MLLWMNILCSRTSLNIVAFVAPSIFCFIALCPLLKEISNLYGILSFSKSCGQVDYYRMHATENVSHPM